MALRDELKNPPLITLFPSPRSWTAQYRAYFPLAHAVAIRHARNREKTLSTTLSISVPISVPPALALLCPPPFVARRWLVRNLEKARSMQMYFHTLGGSHLLFYMLISLLWIPKYTVAQIVPYYVCGWAVHFVLVSFLFLRTRWTVSLLSNGTTLGVVLMASLVSLGGFMRVNPSPLSASALLMLQSGQNVATVEEYENDDPSPFMLAIIALSSAAGPNTAGAGVPATAGNAWMMYIVPATYLIANAAWQQPPARFLKVALLNVYVLTHVASYAFWSVVSRDLNAHDHFFTVRDLGAERELCNRILSLLLPSTIMASMRRPAAAAALPERRGSLDDGSDEILEGGAGVVSLGEERFAERFPDTSVMFAMGKGGNGASLSSFQARYIFIVCGGWQTISVALFRPPPFCPFRRPPCPHDARAAPS